jgi:hypothetical protein
MELITVQLPGSQILVAEHGTWTTSGKACPNAGKLFTAPSLTLSEVKIALESR